MEKLLLEQWHKTIIKQAFSRCWGLQKATVEAIETEDKLMLDACVDTIMRQTAFSEKLIRDNIKEISEL